MMNKQLNQVMNNFLKLIEIVANGKKKVFQCGEDTVLYRGEIHMLKMIGDHPGIYISEMARCFKITRAVVSKTIIKLEEKGLVRKEEDPENKKLVCLYLTPRGQKACDFHDAFHLQNDREIFEFLEGLDEQEVAVIQTFLEKAQSMINKHF
ncbi:MAG: MarR family winged helix-turn-helix transcriptional regulator [Peptococcaceae bacterium]